MSSKLLYNLAAMTVASTGTGTITLGSAATINGVTFLSFAAAGVPDGALVSYSINDVGQSEVGVGTYTSSGTTLTRGAVTSTNSNNAINMTSAAIVRITPIASQFREILTANRTYYVRTDGSNSNTGLANTAGGAFLTLQKAMDVISADLDVAGFTVTVQIADGTYTGGLNITPWVGAGIIVFQGNSGTPSNVIISTTSDDCFDASFGPLSGIFRIKDMKLKTTTSGSCIVSRSVGRVQFTNIVFDASIVHVIATSNAIIEPYGSYSIIGGAVWHFATDNAGAIVDNASDLPSAIGTITLTGTPAFSSAFASAFGMGRIITPGITFSGSATGTRYSATQNALINTNGGGANYFPGNAVGSTASGGQYL